MCSINKCIFSKVFQSHTSTVHGKAVSVNINSTDIKSPYFLCFYLLLHTLKIRVRIVSYYVEALMMGIMITVDVIGPAPTKRITPPECAPCSTPHSFLFIYCQTKSLSCLVTKIVRTEWSAVLLKKINNLKTERKNHRIQSDSMKHTIITDVHSCFILCNVLSFIWAVSL